MKKIKAFFARINKYIHSSGMFSKIIVIFCIAYCVRIIEWSMDQFEVSGMEPSTIINAGLVFFGGELLFLCLKRIFAKSDKKYEYKKKEDQPSEPMGGDSPEEEIAG